MSITMNVIMWLLFILNFSVCMWAAYYAAIALKMKSVGCFLAMAGCVVSTFSAQVWYSKIVYFVVCCTY